MSALPAIQQDPSSLAHLAVLSLSSVHSRRIYARHIERFALTGRPLNREGIQAHLVHMRESGVGSTTRNIALAAVRLLAREANARGELPDVTLGAIERIKGSPIRGSRLGNWLDVGQVRAMLSAARLREHGVRDAALLACMIGCGMRRAEVCTIEWAQWQERGGRWCWIDVHGKGGRVRTIPAPRWVADLVNEWHEKEKI